MTTSLVNRESVSLGLAKIYLGKSTTNIGSTSLVLDTSDYFSALGSVSFNVSREFVSLFSVHNGVEYLQDALLKKVDFGITVSFLEIYQKTLSYALGGDGGSTELGTTFVSGPSDLRVELVFTYPNKTNQMLFILPRMSVLSSVTGTFLEEDALKIPISFNAKRADNVSGGTVWGLYPYGRILFT